MLDFVEKEISVWDRLESANLPIMLYGMGDGAEKIIKELGKRNLTVQEIFASDEFVRGHSWNGYKVRKFSEICETYENFIILVAFGVHDTPTMNRLYEMSKNYELYAPDVPVVGEGAFDLEYFRKHREEFETAYSLMSDPLSRKVFECSLKYKISGKIEYLKEMESSPDEVYENLLKLGQNEVYADLGAYDGDTIREFLRYGGAKRIIALEPDAKNFKKLLKKTEGVEAYNAGAWCEDTKLPFATRGGRNSKVGGDTLIDMRSLDSVLSGDFATYIKLDVEGAEYEALLGAKETIVKNKPRIFCAVYHRNEDLFKIPLLIHRLNPEYKLYLRHYPYIPAWETNIVAI